MGQWCGAVGRAVTSNSRGLRFESSHQQDFIMNIFTINCWKDENKEKKRPVMAHFLFKKQKIGHSSSRGRKVQIDNRKPDRDEVEWICLLLRARRSRPRGSRRRGVGWGPSLSIRTNPSAVRLRAKVCAEKSISGKNWSFVTTASA